MLICVISWNTVCYSRNNVFPFAAAAAAAAISAGMWKQYVPVAQMEIFGKHEPNEMSFTDDVMRGYVHETWAYNQTLNAYFPCPDESDSGKAISTWYEIRKLHSKSNEAQFKQRMSKMVVSSELSSIKVEIERGKEMILKILK